MRDHRARMAFARHQAKERLERALVDQRSQANTPAVRIQMWEHLHQVRLPMDPDHQILLLIAQQTALELHEVREVQSRRALPA